MKKTFLNGAVMSTLMLALILGMAGCSNPAMETEDVPRSSITAPLGSLPVADNEEGQNTDDFDGTGGGQNTGICDGTGQGTGICKGIVTGQGNETHNGPGKGQGARICDGTGEGTGIYCKNP